MIDRRMALQNLKTTLEFRYHWDMGRKSGFPTCCLVWFQLRSLTLSVSELVFRRKPWFAKRKFMEKSRCWRHIGCPYHEHLAPASEIRYYYCELCDWTQFQVQKCHYCGGKCAIIEKKG